MARCLENWGYAVVERECLMIASDAAEEFFALWIYRNLATLRSWGLPAAPSWRLYPHAEKVSAALGPALADIERSVVKTNDPLVFQAPSPWHAALYCHMLQHHVSLAGSRLLFRGQRNYSWPLTPSILRDPDKISHELARAELFAGILSAMSFNTTMSFHPYSKTSVFLKMSKAAYLGAAQHYGIKTHLLDFTTDPDVAVKFATSSGDSDDGMASILILPLEMAEDNGISVILPPPFVRRLHLQRGLFVEARQTLRKEDLKILEVRFPYQPSIRSWSLGSFEVCREGGALVDILPKSNELDEVIRATDETLMKGPTVPDVDEVERIARVLKPHFDAAVSDPQKAWYEYVDTFEDLLYALAYNINANDQMSVDEERLDRIVTANLEVSCSVASLYRAIPQQFPTAYNQEKIEHLRWMANLIDEIASRSGYDHGAAAQGWGCLR
jgi:hypothetical protein